MATLISKNNECDLCGWIGQEVRECYDHYEVPVLSLCLSQSECESNQRLNDYLASKAEEAAAQDAYEAGQNPWAL